VNEPETLRRAVGISTLDLILQVAIIAACLILARGWLGLRLEAKRDMYTSSLRSNLPPSYPDTPREWFAAARVGLLAATFTIISLGLCRPRPLRSASPGMVTLLAVVLAAATSFLDPSVYALAVGGAAFGLIDDGPPTWFGSLRLTPSQVYAMIDATSSDGRAAVAVLVAWSALALTGGWSHSRCWVDRLGRALGLLWVAAHVGWRVYAIVLWVGFGRIL
jgi:hypothetical protein